MRIKAREKIRENNVFHRGIKVINQKKNTFIKTKDFNDNVRIDNEESKTDYAIDKFMGGAITLAQKTKNAPKAAKRSIKTAKQAIKTTTKTARSTIKASQKAVKTAGYAAKTAINTTKATIMALKAIVVALKGTVSLIAIGGVVAVVIIIILLCMAMLVLGDGISVDSISFI